MMLHNILWHVMQQTMYLVGICSNTHAWGNLIQAQHGLNIVNPETSDNPILAHQMQTLSTSDSSSGRTIKNKKKQIFTEIRYMIQYDTIFINIQHLVLQRISISISIVHAHSVCIMCLYIFIFYLHPAHVSSKKTPLSADSMIKSPSWQWFWIWTSHSASPEPDIAIDTADCYYTTMPINIQYITTQHLNGGQDSRALDIFNFNLIHFKISYG